MNALSTLWARPSSGLRFRVYCVAFALGSWVHLTLPDAVEDVRWWPANAAYLAGTVLVLWRGAILGWGLCAVGLAIPLLFFEDQLTQSVILLVGCAASIACWLGREGRDRRMNTTLPRTVGAVTVATYTLASFHKLNPGFFSPEIGCASAGIELLAANWGIEAPQGLLGYAAPAFLIAELVLAFLFVVRPAWALPFAFALHIPLTVVFAPSFAFVMQCGWVCLLDEAQLRVLGRVFAKHWRWIVAAGAALGAGSFALYLRNHSIVYPWWSFREALLWTGLVATVFAAPRLPRRVRERRIPRPHVVTTVVLLYVAHGLSPYTGLQFHHTGAMLSNLRVDRGCWNHWVVPERVRWVEPYVRVDDASVVARGAPVLEERLIDTLWNRRSLARAAMRWCAQGARRIHVRVRFKHQVRDVRNLCETPYPFGQPWLPGMRLHQENARRGCHRICIH